MQILGWSFQQQSYENQYPSNDILWKMLRKWKFAGKIGAIHSIPDSEARA